MPQPKKQTERDILAALARFRRQWGGVPAKPGLDRIAKAASMSNNSVLDLTAASDTPRVRRLVKRLTAGGRDDSKVRTWARLAMQIALVLIPLSSEASSQRAGRRRSLGPPNLEDWVDANEWGLSPEEFAGLLQEARAKISRAEEQLSGTVAAERVRVGIVQLVYLSDDIRPKREYADASTSASFLGAFARLALRSVKPGYEFEYYPVSLKELNPHADDGISRAVKVGVFGIVARERDSYEHIPIPGWRCKFACIGPDIDPTRHAADLRRVFSADAHGFVYVSIRESSPASFLHSMFGRSLPQRLLRRKDGSDDIEYNADDIAAAYAEELSQARDSISGHDSGPIPLLVIDEAMADEVARRIAGRYAAALSWTPPKFIDLLRDLPEGPTVPICIQVHRDDHELIRLLNHAVLDERSEPGELFTLGALPTARAYARAIVWILSRYTYDYARGPGVPAQDSLLSRVQAYIRHATSSATAKGTHLPPRIPAFCRLWPFTPRTAPPPEFVHLLADELVSRLFPAELYDRVAPNAAEQGAEIKELLLLLLPPEWEHALNVWAASRFERRSVRLPPVQDDWREGPAEADRTSG